MGFHDDMFGLSAIADADSNNTHFHIVRRDTVDVLDQAEALPFWSQDYTQLSKGTFSGSVNSVSCNGIQIFTETMNRAVDQIASAPQDSYVIGLPTVVDGQSTWGLLPVTKYSLITLDKNAELYFRTSTTSQITVAVIPAKRLEAYAEASDCLNFIKIMQTIKPVELLQPDVARLLLTILLDGLQIDADDSSPLDLHDRWQQYEQDLMSACLHALLHANENRHPHFDHRIPRYIVNRVRDTTLANSEFPLTIDELCQSLRVSRRTLNHAFIRVLGITPVTYIRNVRLHRIRYELVNMPNGVSNIAFVATRWGFWHMSLFSRYYRELFGECPIDTLQRAKKNVTTKH